MFGRPALQEGGPKPAAADKKKAGDGLGLIEMDVFEAVAMECPQVTGPAAAPLSLQNPSLEIRYELCYELRSAESPSPTDPVPAAQHWGPDRAPGPPARLRREEGECLQRGAPPPPPPSSLLLASSRGAAPPPSAPPPPPSSCPRASRPLSVLERGLTAAAAAG
jgi:hypothetical protein